MPAPPTIAQLIDAVVVLRDRSGRQARFVVDHVSGDTLICSYVFRGRHVAPTRCEVGDEIELGAPADGGWVVATAQVRDTTTAGSLTVEVTHLDVVQRRSAFREEIVVPLVVRERFDDRGRRGRTENLSAGGFAARVQGHPFDDGTDVLVTFSMPERDEVTVLCRKVSGDLQQRFEFIELDVPTQERFARMVRATELAKRRARRDAP